MIEVFTLVWFGFWLVAVDWSGLWPQLRSSWISVVLLGAWITVCYHALAPEPQTFLLGLEFGGFSGKAVIVAIYALIALAAGSLQGTLPMTTARGDA